MDWIPLSKDTKWLNQLKSKNQIYTTSRGFISSLKTNRLSERMEVPQKTKNRITIWSSYSISGYLSPNMTTLVGKIYASLCSFIIALFTTAKLRKQPKCLSTHEWIYNVTCNIYQYNWILLSLKKMKIFHLHTNIYFCICICKQW